MAKVPQVALLIESSRVAGRALLKGIADYAHHHGNWSFYWEPGGLEMARPKLKTLDVDGMILRDVGNLQEILAFGVPAVVVGHQHTEVPGLVNVVTDSAAIGHLAAEHLLMCGFKYFAYCGLLRTQQERTPWSGLREDAFGQRLKEAGFACDSHAVAGPDHRSWQADRRAMVAWLRSLPKPCGLMACNDDLGKEVIEACKLAGFRIPDEMAIIGADNDELVCSLSDPPMSSVAINFERAGYEAASALHRLMKGERRVPRRIVVRATHVVPRRSTDIVAVEDRHLARALIHIRGKAQTGVTVAAAARAAGLSRRAMEKRFRKSLNRSALEEIRRVRTDQIARLLIETELPVARVAEILGFADVRHVARYFRAGKGLSPLAYRKAQGRKAAQA